MHTSDQNIHFFRKRDIFVTDFRPILLNCQDVVDSSENHDRQSDADGESDNEDDEDQPDLVSDDSNSDSDLKEDATFTAIAQVNTVCREN